MRLPFSSFLSARPESPGSPLEDIWLVQQDWDQPPHVHLADSKHFTVPASFYVSSPNTAACHTAALLLTMCSPVLVLKNEPATVHPVHNEFLLWSSNLVWLEQDLLTERCDLLIECFASANVDGRQCPCCMTYQPFQNRAVETNRGTNLSFSAVLDCTNLPLDGLVHSLNATVGVAVSDWTFFVHDFGWDVRANFVFDVDDAGFLLALQHHFPMTCGQNVVCKCSFCVTMTRAFARYNVSKECLRQSVITS